MKLGTRATTQPIVEREEVVIRERISLYTHGSTHSSRDNENKT